MEVDDGIVTLRGYVDYFYQRAAAMKDAGEITGVLGIVDMISVQSRLSTAEDISGGIALAFARHAELADDNVSVSVDGSTATLSRTVRIWSEYEEAEDVAWRAPGITDVVNNIGVTY